jgi:hypothetical protein
VRWLADLVAIVCTHPLLLLPQYLRYMTFVVETAIKNMKNGQEQWVWMLDLAGARNAAVLV